jgi:hypothetical protein
VPEDLRQKLSIGHFALDWGSKSTATILLPRIARVIVPKPQESGLTFNYDAVWSMARSAASVIDSLRLPRGDHTIAAILAATVPAIVAVSRSETRQSHRIYLAGR